MIEILKGIWDGLFGYRKHQVEMQKLRERFSSDLARLQELQLKIDDAQLEEAAAEIKLAELNRELSTLMGEPHLQLVKKEK